jgi:hypothetical protein
MEKEKESSRKESKKASKNQMDKETGKAKTFQPTTVQTIKVKKKLHEADINPKDTANVLLDTAEDMSLSLIKFNSSIHLNFLMNEKIKKSHH